MPTRPTRAARESLRTGSYPGSRTACPICGRMYQSELLQEHADRCAARRFSEDEETPKVKASRPERVEDDAAGDPPVVARRSTRRSKGKSASEKIKVDKSTLLLSFRQSPDGSLNVCDHRTNTTKFHPATSESKEPDEPMTVVQPGRKRRRDRGAAARSPSPDGAASAASSGAPQNALDNDHEASEANSSLQNNMGEDITKIQGKNTPIMSWDVAEVKPELVPLLQEADDRISRISERALVFTKSNGEPDPRKIEQWQMMIDEEEARLESFNAKRMMTRSGLSSGDDDRHDGYEGTGVSSRKRRRKHDPPNLPELWVLSEPILVNLSAAASAIQQHGVATMHEKVAPGRRKPQLLRSLAQAAYLVDKYEGETDEPYEAGEEEPYRVPLSDSWDGHLPYANGVPIRREPSSRHPRAPTPWLPWPRPYPDGRMRAYAKGSASAASRRQSRSQADPQKRAKSPAVSGDGSAGPQSDREAWQFAAQRQQPDAALEYIQKMRDECRLHGEIIYKFAKHVEAYCDGAISRATVVDEVEQLLRGYPDLIKDFHALLGPASPGPSPAPSITAEVHEVRAGEDGDVLHTTVRSSPMETPAQRPSEPAVRPMFHNQGSRADLPFPSFPYAPPRRDGAPPMGGPLFPPRPPPFGWPPLQPHPCFIPPTQNELYWYMHQQSQQNGGRFKPIGPVSPRTLVSGLAPPHSQIPMMSPADAAAFVASVPPNFPLQSASL